MADISYKIIVGLEIHVHLATRTKMFCGCELAYGQAPNTRVCPVCIGMPGVLPVMNKTAVEYAMLTGLALNCDIARFTKWDRKSYYYPDLPKNYQISQYDLPLAGQGYIEIPLEDGTTKKIRILRAHLEEDAGKNTHTLGNFSAVDLNRAGTPLLEIVTEPDMNSPVEVRLPARRSFSGLCGFSAFPRPTCRKATCGLSQTSTCTSPETDRCSRPRSPRSRISTVFALERSVAYEVSRQLDEFMTTGKTLKMGNKSTYGWDDVNQRTVLLRKGRGTRLSLLSRPGSGAGGGFRPVA